MAEQRVQRGYVVSFVVLLVVGDQPFNHPGPTDPNLQ